MRIGTASQSPVRGNRLDKKKGRQPQWIHDCSVLDGKPSPRFVVRSGGAGAGKRLDLFGNRRILLCMRNIEDP